MNSLDKHLLPIMQYAWEEIMKIYNSWDFDADQKADWSPVTIADKLCNEILSEAIIKVFNSPILSEEDIMPSFEERSQWIEYWMIDPIDGTKSFLYKNWEFCICLTYMKNHKPIYSVIYDPQKKIFYSAKKNKWSHMYLNWSRNPLKAWAIQTSPFRFLNSQPTWHEDVKKELLNTYPLIQEQRMFSALKFTHMAQDHADLFSQNRATHYRDTSAGELIAKEAWLETYSSYEWNITQWINYNTPTTLNNPFLVMKPGTISETLIETLLLNKNT